MAAPGRLGTCLDEACGRPMAAVLRTLRAPGSPDIHDVREIGLAGASDEVLMRELGQRGYAAMVTRDSSILNASLRRAAWRDSGLTLFVLTGKWGNLSLFDQARHLLWWWPTFASRVADGPHGSAWRIAPEMTASHIVRIFPDIEAS